LLNLNDLEISIISFFLPASSYASLKARITLHWSSGKQCRPFPQFVVVISNLVLDAKIAAEIVLAFQNCIAIAITALFAVKSH